MRFARRRTMNGAVVVTLAISAFCRAATLHVPADYPTIQSCIDAAVSGTDECVVAPGTYNEMIDFLGKAITLRSSGGAEITTIDAAGLGGSVVTCASGEGPDTILAGFTITGGTGTDLFGYRSAYGGGMYNDSSSPTVTNCTFSENTADYGGGGMYNHDSNPTVTNCTFTENTATYDSGGGMYNSWGSPSVTNCTFSENTAVYGGGGMYNYSGLPTVTNCTFSGNMADDNGGGMSNYYSSPTVRNCTFSGNTAAYSGGGMVNYLSSPAVSGCTFSGNTAFYGGGMYNEGGSPVVIKCTFNANTAMYAGGMFNSSSDPMVAECTYIGNSATYWGGGMYNHFSNPTVIRCTLRGNTASYGAGMNNFLSDPTVTHCTFTGNTADDRGGGLYNQGGSPTVTHCTFTGNTTARGGGMENYASTPTVFNCILWGDSPNEILDIAEAAPTIAFSDVQGGLPAGAIDAGGNIDVDPMFMRPPDRGPDGTWDGVDDDYGDLRVRGGSPCINAGDPGLVAPPGETDLDGHARVLCGRVEMGAYEFGIGDYDCDQSVDMSDFFSWPECMSGPSGAELRMANDEERMEMGGGTHARIEDLRFEIADACAAFDFDGDGDVDLRDLAGFQRVFAGP